MNAAKQASWLFFTLIALAISGLYYGHSAVPVKLDEQTLATTPDSIVTTLAVHQFNEQGHLVNFLQSPEMRHIPYEDTHLFTQPYIIISQEKQADWTIRAQEAHAVHKGEQVTFLKNVIIHQDKSAENQANTFKTERLLYLPKQKFASTTDPVTFIQPGTIVKSTGMQAYLDTKRVILLNHARAIYQPKQA